MTSLDELCRLCLAKEQANVPIFDDEGDVRQTFLKIHACLPVKVDREDKLPKKICDDCSFKVESFYEFWNTTANAEKQLLQWLGETGGLEDKQTYVTEVLDSNVMKQEQQGSDTRINVVQVSGQSNMDINMIENMSIITMPAGSEQQFTSVPMDTSGGVQSSSQTTHEEVAQSQTDISHLDHDEDNSYDGCDNDDGLPVKEETEEDQNEQTLEPAFVSMPCDEAGPSGLQQQKITEISTDGDPKTGYYVAKLMMPPSLSHEVVVASDSQSPNHQRQQQHQQQQQQIKVYAGGEQSATTLLMAANSIDEGSNMIVLQANDTTVYQCSLCGGTFADTDSLNYHLKTHGIAETNPHQASIVKLEESVILLACNACGQTFRDDMLLDEHQRQEHGSDKPMYACGLCDYTSMSMEEIHNHQLEHRTINEFKYVNTGPTVQVNEQVQYVCEICNATFKYRQGLSLHQKLHQPDYVQTQKKHCCEICKKRFCRKQVLLVHMKTHGGTAVQETNNEFVCHVCGKAVSSKTYLTVHMRKHTGEKPHVCDICKKGFISQSYLSVHRRTHTGERPHKCMHCDKSFTQRTTLVVHTRSHTGDKPYRCTDCGKSFASKTMLNSHLKTHAKAHARAQQEHITLQQQNMLIVGDGVNTIGIENPPQEEEIMVEPDSSGIALVST